MKSIFIRIALNCLIILLISSSVTAQSSTNWNDDFDDGDLDGWISQVGSFNISNGKLYADYGVKDGGKRWAVIDHSSDVAYGIWSFDVLSIRQKRPHIMFIGEGNWQDDVYNYAAPTNSYAIVIEYDNWDTRLMYFDFGRYSDGIHWDWLAEFKPVGGLNGWQHINVTRNPEGLFKIYINGSLRMEVTDNVITSSDRFEIFTETGTEFDNIEVISKEIVPEIIPTTSSFTNSNTTSNTESSSNTTNNESSSFGYSIPILVVALFMNLIYYRRRK